MKRIFPSIPQILLDNIGELDRMRVLRNNVAHAFGRDIKTARLKGITILDKAERLQLKRLQKWMGLIADIVRQIDIRFLNDHIGEYESIYFYHINRTNIISNHGSRTLKNLINKENISQLRSNQFCIELINFYESI